MSKEIAHSEITTHNALDGLIIVKVFTSTVAIGATANLPWKFLLSITASEERGLIK
jgi:hypothetical protein